MKLITDRTRTDVLTGNEKGFYTVRDLNRVERKVAELCEKMRALDIVLKLQVSTDWEQTRRIPTHGEMTRYLQNVHRVALAMGLDPTLPERMEHLNYQGANQIESALKQAEGKVQSILQTHQMSGELFAGEENEI